jgi:hypothetical protein
MDVVLVVAILAGGYLFWALCKALRQTFSKAAQHQRNVWDEFNRDRLQSWWDRTDPRNQQK